ncbi:MAG: cell division protein FtsZ [Candidatus Jordarchaeales archaeon]|nr:cell division protein FtsZ [Candidatus Jordarchaeia archaeon]
MSLIRDAIKHTREINVDKELKVGEAKIAVIGTGGAGNNTVDRLMHLGVIGAECIAVNTDKQHLDRVRAHKKLLIGRRITGGRGAGGFPHIGEAAAEESKEEIAELLRGIDLVFISAGMGGGTGTGSAPVIAEIAKKMGAIVVGVVTMPFKMEKGRIQKAVDGLKKLRYFADTVVVIDNNRLLSLVPNLPLDEAFSVADEILANMVKGITETISLPSLINLDYADVQSVLKNGGVAMVGIGEGEGENRVEKAVKSALDSPLLDVDITGASGALIHVTGGPDMTLTEATRAGELITEKMVDDALVIWGARIDPSLIGTIRIILILTGVSSPQLLGPAEFERTGLEVLKPLPLDGRNNFFESSSLILKKEEDDMDDLGIPKL